jgi:uncharacterized protein YbaP (TraB family)
MFPRVSLRHLFAQANFILCLAISADGASVWKATTPNGGTVYLGGSVHALKSTDYPLPPEYNRAFDASARLIFEVDHKAMTSDVKRFFKAGEYGRNDSLKNHVDPRTYNYLRRLFGLMRVPETTYSKYRPWFLYLLLTSASAMNRGISYNLGVEDFLSRRAKATSKPTSGLESPREHLDVMSALTDRQSEALLLLTFIPQTEPGDTGNSLTAAWRRGDAETITGITLRGFQDFPSLGDRLLTIRNRNWIAKIERFAQSKQTHFVIVGAAHMGGPGGLLAMLRQRGYRIEQL